MNNRTHRIVLWTVLGILFALQLLIVALLVAISLQIDRIDYYFPAG